MISGGLVLPGPLVGGQVYGALVGLHFGALVGLHFGDFVGFRVLFLQRSAYCESLSPFNLGGSEPSNSSDET